MSLYRFTRDKLEPIPRTTFAAEGVFERQDIQRLLRQDIRPLGDDLLVLAEEYADWEDSQRRIDLLCLASDGDLVVVEIKRTEDGGHMELQAVRYAAMVSSMTLDQVVHTFARTAGIDHDVARTRVHGHLASSGGQEPTLSGDVRVVLVAADFGRELTTAVLWLNKRDLDITCVRMRPYRADGQVFVDIVQVIPLPEASEYEVRLRVQQQERRSAEAGQREVRQRYWAQLIERGGKRTPLLAGRSPVEGGAMSNRVGREGFDLPIVVNAFESRVECYIDRAGGAEANQAAFDELHQQKEAIEAAFGEPLDWQDLPNRAACRICKHVRGGWKSPEGEWPALQDRQIDVLVRLDAALRQRILSIRS